MSSVQIANQAHENFLKSRNADKVYDDAFIEAFDKGLPVEQCRQIAHQKLQQYAAYHAIKVMGQQVMKTP